MVTWNPKFPEMLSEHMKKGKSFVSFAAVAGCSFSALYDWIDPNSPRFHPDFLQAKECGDPKVFAMDEEIGTAGITGQLRRVTSATIVRDDNGKEVSRNEKYAAATFSATAYNFRMKNRWPQFYKDRTETTVTDPDGNAVEPVQIVIAIPSNGKEKK